MTRPIVLDAAQRSAAQRLDALAKQIGSRRTVRILRRAPPPRGLYLWGAVGRGKTMLMDAFFAKARSSPKRRLHFNVFMAEMHERVHAYRAQTGRGSASDPIAPVARSMAADAALLCLDEFEVRDIADAMILARVFEQLIAQGVVMVMTSNTPPERLYEGGLNRQLFLPFIALVELRLDIVELKGERDYRLARMAGLDLYVTPLGPAADAALDRAWSRLTDDAKGEPERIAILGRTLEVPRAAHGVARFSFDELCARPLAAADYMALARRYHVLMIDRIPRMSEKLRDPARRFGLLIDTLYDERVRLVCSAAAPPAALCAEGANAHMFRRTASRLIEMQSVDYITRAQTAAPLKRLTLQE